MGMCTKNVESIMWEFREDSKSEKKMFVFGSAC